MRNNQRRHRLKKLGGLLVVCAIGWLSQTQANGWQAQLRQWRLGKSANNARFVGQQVCAECHSAIAKRYVKSGMAFTLMPGAAFERAPLSLKLGDFEYRIERQGAQLSYTITRGAERFDAPLLWTFGHGASGHTFVLQHAGKFYESRVSYFTNLSGLEITPGAPTGIPASLEAAIGQPLNENTALGCFQCHTTPSVGTNATTLAAFTPNIQCEACHGAGEAHWLAAKAGKLIAAKRAIFNPSRWQADDLNQQFCGACHRSWETVMKMPDHGGVANVRFQPYRLANSKCYQNPDDRRISCVACHDPHTPLSHDVTMYDTKCLACHQDSAKPTAVKSSTGPKCRAGKTADCATCHMPKVEPTGLHFKFTDHWIRVVKAGVPHPQ